MPASIACHRWHVPCHYNRPMRRYFPDFDTFRGRGARRGRRPGLSPAPGRPPDAGDARSRCSAGTPHAFLLESVVGGEKIARYSFIATAPVAGLPGAGGKALDHAAVAPAARPTSSTPPIRWRTCRSCCPTRRYHRDPSLPAFTGGLVGYAGYDTIRYYEGEKLTSPAEGRPPAARPARSVSTTSWSSSTTSTRRSRSSPTRDVERRRSDGRPPTAAYPRRLPADRRDRRSACSSRPTSELGEIDPTRPAHAEVREQLHPRAVRGRRPQRARSTSRPATSSSSSPASGCACRATADPFDVYRALRIINPSPFMFYLKSAELHADRRSPGDPVPRGGRQGHHPPARRHAPPRRDADDEDQALETELLADPKERAEHIMLVDLHRNDVGRVAKVGTRAGRRRDDRRALQPRHAHHDAT